MTAASGSGTKQDVPVLPDGVRYTHNPEVEGGQQYTVSATEPAREREFTREMFERDLRRVAKRQEKE